MSEAGQIEGDDVPLGREHGQLLEPVWPGAGQPVDEDERLRRLIRRRAELDRVDREPVEEHPALVLAPVDLKPG